MSRIEHAGRGVRRRRWLYVGGGSGATLVAGTTLLASVLDPAVAVRWSIVVCPVLLYEAWFFHSRRGPQSVPVGQASVTLPNAVTLLRGWLYAAVAGFVVVQPRPVVVWLPGLCYGLGVALDQVDGRLARRTDSESRLGEQLDATFDGIGFLAAPAVAVAWSQLPVWYLLLPAADVLFKLGRSVRRRRGLEVVELRADSRRRLLSGIQMAFLAVALLPFVPPDVLEAVGVVALTPSLLLFVRDYLVVAGHYRPPSRR
jgi:CDP-diacylglycerol--glycerol-3-phosphate 3-phosphatidyltransferase